MGMHQESFEQLLLVGRSTREIQNQLTEAESGSSIQVEPGIYIGSLTVEKPLSLFANGDVVLANFEHPENQGKAILKSSESLSMEGFTIYASSSNAQAFALEKGGVLKNNTFNYSGYSGSGVISFKDELMLRGNKIFSHADGNMFTAFENEQGTTSLTMVNNVLSGRVRIKGLLENDALTMVANTIYMPDEMTRLVYFGAPNTTLINNAFIMLRDECNLVLAGVDIPMVVVNNYFPSVCETVVDGKDNIFAGDVTKAVETWEKVVDKQYEPLLDWIDMGQDVSQYTTVDLYGNTREFAGNTDIGAVELQQ